MSEDKSTLTSARGLAAELLHRGKVTGPFISDLFDRLAEESGLDARDRHLAHELASGVVRHRRTLDRVADAFSRRPLVKSPLPLRQLVRLGLYQLLFLDRIPDHAAVDQTVELAKQWARPRIRKHPTSIASFVNGLLRAVASGRQVVQTPAGADPRRLVERPVVDSFLLMDRDVFASQAETPGEWLADAYSINGWLAGRWVERLGLTRAIQVARAQNRRPGLTMRINTLRTDLDSAVALLAEQGVEARPIQPGQPLLRVLSGDALGCPAMQQGLIQPQDAWSAAVVKQLNVKPGQTVLDRCAAPGTKTSQIAERLRGQGQVFAVDVAPAGLQRVRDICDRMGCGNVTTLLAEDMPQTLVQLGRIDRALVDAPCSNSGVLARRPEARWRVGPEHIEELAAAQRQLLMDAINWVVPGGLVVYSTCSIEPEENEQVVEYATRRRRRDLRLVGEKLTLPSLKDDHDGGYWAIIERLR